MRLDMYAGRYVDDPHALMLCPRVRRTDFFFFSIIRTSGRLAAGRFPPPDVRVSSLTVVD